MSWEVIIPFLRPIEPLLRDPDISDVMVNGSGSVFAEKEGRMYPVPDVAINEKSLQVAVRNIARVLGDDINEEQPLLDARLPDGSRVAAVFPPCSIGGTTLTIRKFQSKKYTADELVRIDALPAALLIRLQDAVQRRQNMLIAGGTGAGKTTLLNALAALIPEDERLVVIEDTSEIQIDKPNLVRLEVRREQPGVAAVTIRDLLKATLRLRPDRILVGEVRDGAAFDLLQVLNTGHSGTLSTIHANSARDVLSRFTTCVLQSGINQPYRSIRRNIAESVHLLVYLSRNQGKRQVTEVLAVRNYEPDQDRYELEVLYER